MKTSILLKLFIAKNSPELQIGALLEEHILETNQDSYPQKLIDGHNHQQLISSVFVNHPAYLKSEALLDSKLSKSSDKIIPMFYDHFLRLNWEACTEVAFEDFYKNLDQTILKYQHHLPYKQNKLIKNIHQHNWYHELKTIGGTHSIMKGQTKRTTFYTNLEQSIENLMEHYAEHRDNFFEILPDLQHASREFLVMKRELVLGLDTKERAILSSPQRNVSFQRC